MMVGMVDGFPTESFGIANGLSSISDGLSIKALGKLVDGFDGWSISLRLDWSFDSNGSGFFKMVVESSS